DIHSTIIYANPNYSRILNVPVEKVLGKKISDIEPTSKSLEVLKTKVPILGEYDLVKSINKHVVFSTTPFFDGAQILGAIGIFRDVTEVVQLNEQIIKLKGYNEKLINEFKEDLPESFNNIFGADPSLIKVLNLAAQVAPSDVNIVIEGESGVGKGLIAKALHQASKRKDGPFVNINCSAIPKNLFESEFFGYAGGSFTGAKKEGHLGKFELANGGTLFLDEIGEIPLTMQPKLLRALQDGEIDPIGATKPHIVDVRVFAATNQCLLELTNKGLFRKDLYYRLNVVNIKIPPLCERENDIVLIAQKILEKDFPNYHFLDETLEILKNHEWPGNIRELQNVIKHGIVMSKNGIIKPIDLPDYIQTTSNEIGNIMNLEPMSSFNNLFKEKVGNREKELILQALKQCNNNRSAAIKMLGICRGTFYKKLKAFELL
ncbi:MAG: sigma 54-interacting transcriptional regulator, partial [Desulfosporosinus sp.]